jgi:NAD(P)-dependent dehydrogenase (short-subunit alcohol dehydrogenase family)
VTSGDRLIVESMKLEAGRVAVVTGGASGIGFALAELLVRRGLDVLVADVRGDALPAALDALTGHPGRVAGFRADVSLAADVDAMAAETVGRFGRVDLVCNNAGVVCELTPAWKQRPETWRWLIDVKLMGVVNGVRAFTPHFLAQGSGHFLNTASAGGLIPLPHLAPYNATMHAVVGLTETLNLELRSAAPSIGATVLCPGMVDTPLGPNSANLVPPGAVATPTDRDDDAMRGAISPTVVAQAALDAVEAERVHAVVGPGAAAASRQRIDALLADLG